jgi:hypothetical protein
VLGQQYLGLWSSVAAAEEARNTGHVEVKVAVGTVDLETVAVFADCTAET